MYRVLCQLLWLKGFRAVFLLLFISGTVSAHRCLICGIDLIPDGKYSWCPQCDKDKCPPPAEPSTSRYHPTVVVPPNYHSGALNSHQGITLDNLRHALQILSLESHSHKYPEPANNLQGTSIQPTSKYQVASKKMEEAMENNDGIKEGLNAYHFGACKKIIETDQKLCRRNFRNCCDYILLCEDSGHEAQTDINLAYLLHAIQNEGQHILLAVADSEHNFIMAGIVLPAPVIDPGEGFMHLFFGRSPFLVHENNLLNILKKTMEAMRKALGEVRPLKLYFEPFTPLQF